MSDCKKCGVQEGGKHLPSPHKTKHEHQEPVVAEEVTIHSGDGLDFISLQEARHHHASTKPSKKCKQLAKPTPQETTCDAKDGGYRCNGDLEHSCKSEGKTLCDTFTDACEADEVVLLARKGNKLSKLIGTGFVFIEHGIAKIAKELHLQVAMLNHKWFQPTSWSPPVIGEPEDADYLVVGIEDGALRLTKGLSDSKSIMVYDNVEKAWQVKSVSDFPTTKKGALPRGSKLQLTGYEAMLPNSNPNQVRELKALGGSGLVYLAKTPSITESIASLDDCGCPTVEVDHVDVAKVAPFPSGCCAYIVKYQEDTGIYFEPCVDEEHHHSCESKKCGAEITTNPCKPEKLERTSQIHSASEVQNLNLDGSLLFDDAPNAENGWIHSGGTNSFIFVGSPRRTEITIRINSTGTNSSPILELRRNNVVVAKAFASKEGNEIVNALHFVDMESGFNPTYSVTTKKSATMIDPSTIVLGSFDAVAII